MSINCFSCRQWIRDALNGNLKKSRQIALTKHIENCSDCRADWEQEQRLAEVLRQMPRVTPSENLQNHIWHKIDAHQKMPMQFPHRVTVFGLGMGLAIASVIFLVWQLPQRDLRIHPLKPALVVSHSKSPSTAKDETTDSIAAPAQEESFAAGGIDAEHSGQNITAIRPVLSMSSKVHTSKKETTVAFQMPAVSKSNSRLKVRESVKTGNIKNTTHTSSEHAPEKRTISSVNILPMHVMVTPEADPVRFNIYQNVIHVQKGEHCRFELVLREPASISLSIYSRVGKKMITVVQAPLNAGTYEWTWNGVLENGQSAASGVYFAIWQMDQRVIEKQKIVVIK